VRLIGLIDWLVSSLSIYLNMAALMFIRSRIKANKTKGREVRNNNKKRMTHDTTQETKHH